MSRGTNQRACFLRTARRLEWDNDEVAFDERLKGDYQAEAQARGEPQ